MHVYVYRHIYVYDPPQKKTACLDMTMQPSSGWGGKVS